MFSRAWLANAFHVVLAAFLTSFIGVLTASGLNVVSLGTVKGAAVAGLAAAVAALQALLAAPVSPSTSSTALLPKALGQRARALLQPSGAHAAPLTQADLVAALRTVFEEARAGERGALGFGLLARAWDRVATEPVSFTGVVQALIGLLLLFGLVHWTDAQTGGVITFVAAVLAFLTRRAVTSNRRVAAERAEASGPERAAEG